MTRRFEFVSGSSALDLVDTVSGRKREEIELLPDVAALLRWLSEASLMPSERLTLTEADVQATRALREAIFHCATAAVGRRPLSGTDLSAINLAAAASPLRPQRVQGRTVLRAANGFNAVLSSLAEDALRLFMRPHIERLRTCEECGMLFLDRSRPGRRRWCSSSSGCGNRAKVRNFRNRNGKATTQ